MDKWFNKPISESVCFPALRIVVYLTTDQNVFSKSTEVKDLVKYFLLTLI